jgi:hypothetical protein
MQFMFSSSMWLSMFSYGCAALILYRIASVNHLHSLNFKEEERWIIQAPDVLSIVACAQKNDSWKIEAQRLDKCFSWNIFYNVLNWQYEYGLENEGWFVL